MPWIAGQPLQGGKYVIETFLGEGGFGITYKARQVKLNRAVVIKTPKEHLSYDSQYKKYVERFIKEGQILASLSQDPHPHIVGVIDLFQEGNTHCLVMEFLEGETLYEAVNRRGALPETEIVRYIRQLGETLVKVHQKGLVHRDATPRNIILRKDRTAVLIDFGIAKTVVPSTQTSVNIHGTSNFVPYEQIHKGSRYPTVDVYALAATLYYAVTGQVPTESMARKLENIPLKPPKQIIPSISEQLNQAILTGMALEAQDRPQSMQAWLAMLEAPQATPPPPVEAVHRKEVVYPKVEVKSELTSPRIIPWGWLIGVLSIYLLVGYLLVASYAPIVVWGIAVAVAVAVAGAGAMTVFVAVVVAVAVVMYVAFALTRAGALAMVVAGVVAGVVAVAGDKLRESFSRFDTFRILVLTSLFGLGLGLLVHQVFN